MIVLKPIINVRELPPSGSRIRQALPSVRSLIRDTAEDNESAVLKYLGQGVPCGVYPDPGLLQDVLTTGNLLDGDAYILLTDGCWLWPKALLYYVSKYHLQLPAVFVAHAERNQWQIDTSTVPRDQLNIDEFVALPAVGLTPSPVGDLIDANHPTVPVLS